MSSRVVDDILAGIELASALWSHLTAAKAVAEQGGALTDEQRAALDAANDLRKSGLLAAIAARIGPDPDDPAAAAPGPVPPADDAAAVLAKARESEIARLREENATLAARLAEEQAALPPPDAAGPVEP